MELSTEVVESEVLKKCKGSELDQNRIVELQLEIEKRKSDYEALEANFKEVEAKKNAIEVELKGLKAKYGEVEGVDGVVDLTEEVEEDKMVQLMIENKVLECEKQRAEREVEDWKEKYKEMELRYSKLDDNVVWKGGKQVSNQVTRAEHGASPICNPQGTPCSDIKCNCTVDRRLGAYLASERKCSRQVRRNISFDEDKSPNKKMAPSTPGYVSPVSPTVINIGDSDDEAEVSGIHIVTPGDQGNGKVCISKDHSLGGASACKNLNIFENNSKGEAHDQIHREDVDICNDYEYDPCVSTPKRKRAANIISSETESGEDDIIPISKLKRMHLQEAIPPKVSFDKVSSVGDDVEGPVTCSRRRLATLRQHEEKVKAGSSSNNTCKTNRMQGIPTTDDVEDSESDEAESESGGDSLDGFIVGDSYVSDADDGSDPSEDKSHVDDGVSEPEDEGNDSSSLSEEDSDADVDFGKILSRFQRSKDREFKWVFEGDMLADFGKYPELCMKAVCALYRQQTAEEKFSKETLDDNGRGFSKIDALRGSKLAEFLLDGDPSGDVKKSVEDLQEYDSTAVKLCRSLATRYSKQLFQIYKNKEDPFFLPHDQARQCQ